MSLFTPVMNTRLKSGRIQVVDNTWTVVSFTTPFKSIPNVILTMEDEVGIIENLSVRNITINGFEIHQELKIQSNKWIQWIATDKGN